MSGNAFISWFVFRYHLDDTQVLLCLGHLWVPEHRVTAASHTAEPFLNSLFLGANLLSVNAVTPQQQMCIMFPGSRDFF